MPSRPALTVVLLGLVLPTLEVLAQPRVDIGGRTSVRSIYSLYPDDSLLRDLAGSSALDSAVDMRWVGDVRWTSWDVKADYQFIVVNGERVAYSRDFAAFDQLFGRLPNDDRRLFNLTDVIRDQGETAVLQRFDRLSVGYTGRKAVLRFGRQALSWGNGLIYAPLDIVNPFDPTAVDREYKTGDDMLYGQYLRDNGDDLQLAVVGRRDLDTGDIETDEFTFALKYHGVLEGAEYDVLIARNYGDPLVAIGGNRELGGAVWRADLLVTDTDTEDLVAQVVTNLSYSWLWGGKNVTGVVEYFFNGFGRRDGCYSPTCLATSPELLDRIARRELFTLGRHYLVGSATLELTPLFTITPNVFVNLGDGSALLQVNTRHDLAENFVLLGSASLPVGPNGTELAGIEAGVPGRFLAQDFSLFLQLNWYY